jgi:hypothetical protein
MMGQQVKKLTERQKRLDVNNDGVIDEKDFKVLNADRTGGDTMKLKKAGGGMVKKYARGGEVCPNRPDGIRGGGCAQGGMAYKGVK